MKREYILDKKKIVLTINTDADDSVFHEIFTEREYKIIDPIIQKAQNLIIDIGAHIGLFSLYARAINPTVPILAFEPEPNNYALLKENLKTNRVQNITTKALAVTSEIGEITLNISADSHNHSTILQTENQIKVQSTTLDHILKKQPQTNIDLVKMDCEGAEFEIIAGTSEETFAKIDAFYIEYHQYSPEMKKELLKSVLEKHGFETKIVSSHYDSRMGFVLARKQHKS